MDLTLVVTTYERPEVGAADSWRTSALSREMQLVEARVGRRLAEAGYEHIGLAPLSIGPLMRLRLRGQSRYRRTRFNVERYGLSALGCCGLLSSRSLGGVAAH